MKKILVFAEHTHHFSSRLVHIGMFLFQTIRFEKPQKVYNHWGFRDKKNNVNYEALAKGVTKTKRNLVSDSLTWEIEITDEAYNYLEKQLNKKYEYSNFLFHALKIVFPKWLGSKTDKKHSCVELIERVLRKSGYNVPKFINPVELKLYLEEVVFLRKNI